MNGGLILGVLAMVVMSLGLAACAEAPGPTPTSGAAKSSGITPAGGAAPAPEPSKLLESVVWRGHDTFIIKGATVIYVDPYQLKSAEPKADLILITHDHGDHCSPDDVAKIAKADTTIVAVPACAPKLKGDIKTVKPGDKLEAKGVSIQAVPAYNTNKFRGPGVPFHPKESGFVGYLFTAGGVRYYHAGDTDNIPEMAGLAPDVAFLPVSGQYVMTVDEAVEAAKAVNAKVTVPMHYGGSIGTPQDGESFKSKAGVPVVVLPRQE